MATQNFLQRIFDNELEEGYLLIWTAPDKRSHWFQSTQEAADFIKKTPKEKHVYFGMGISPKNYGDRNRCAADKICALPCIGIDLDAAHPTKTDKPYFDSKEVARQFLHSTLSEQFQPTITVDSGHGLIALWVFNEPWELDSAKENHKAAKFFRRFVYTMRYLTSLRGYDLDATTDLARVWRVPGTWNCKDKENPVEVKVWDETANLFNPDDFEDWLMQPPNDDAAAITDEQHANYLKLRVNELKEAPKETIDALKDADELFANTWDRKRGDLKSLSEHDMALANLCVKYDVADQTIAEVIIAFRKKHGKSKKDIQKAFRVSYLNTTINKAKIYSGMNKADEDLEASYIQLKEHENNKEVPKPNKNNVLRKLQLVLGDCPLQKIVKYPGDKPTYELFLEDGRCINIGDVNNLINQGKLRSQMTAHLNIYFPRYQTHVWDKYVKLLLDIVVEEQVSMEATRKGQIYNAIKEYIAETGMPDDYRHAMAEKQPLEKDGRTYIFLPAFFSWLKSKGYIINMQDVSQIFSQLGINNKTLNMRNDENKKTTRYAFDVTPIFEGNYKGKILSFRPQEANDHHEEETDEDDQGTST